MLYLPQSLISETAKCRQTNSASRSQRSPTRRGGRSWPADRGRGNGHRVRCSARDEPAIGVASPQGARAGRPRDQGPGGAVAPVPSRRRATRRGRRVDGALSRLLRDTVRPPRAAARKRTNTERNDEHGSDATRLHAQLDARRPASAGLSGVDRPGPPRLVLQRPPTDPERADRGRPTRRRSLAPEDGHRRQHDLRDGRLYREIVEDENLVFTWGATDGWPKIDPERLDESPLVTVTLSQISGKTEMTRSRRAAREPLRSRRARVALAGDPERLARHGRSARSRIC